MKLFHTSLFFSLALIPATCTDSVSQPGKDGSNIRLNTFSPGYFSVSPDNRYLATASVDGLGGISFIDLERGEVTGDLNGSVTGFGEKFPSLPQGRSKGFTYSRDGKSLLIRSDLYSGVSTLSVVDLASQTVTRTFSAGSQRTLAVSAGENYVLSERNDGIFELYDFHKGTKVKSFKPIPEFEGTQRVIITPDEKYLVAFKKEGTVYFLSLFTEKLETIRMPESQRELKYLEFSENGKYFVSYGKKELLIWETGSGKIARSIPLEGREIFELLLREKQPFRWSGDRYLAGITTKGATPEFFCWDVDTGEVLWTVSPSNPDLKSVIPKLPTTVDFNLSADAQKAYFSLQFSPDIWVGDASGKFYPAVRNPTEYNLLAYSAFTPEGHELFVTFGDGKIHKWDLYRGIYAGIFATADLAISALSISQDNSRLIVKGTLPEADLFNFNVNDINFDDIEGSLERIKNQSKHRAFEFDLKTGAALARNAIPDHSSNHNMVMGNQPSEVSLEFRILTSRHTLHNTLQESLVMATLRGSENDFVVCAPDGRFDGTERGIKELLRAAENGRYVSIDGYRSQYYTPGLLRQFAFPGQKEAPVQAPAILVQAATGDQPLYQVSLTNQNGGIGPVEVYAGDRLIEEDARKLVSHNVADIADRQEVSFSLDMTRYALDPFSEAVIRIVAYDKGKNVNSENRDIAIVGTKGIIQEQSEQPEAARSSAVRNGGPNLWVVTIGVSNYENSDLNLRFSARDAEAMGIALQLAGSALFSRERTHLFKLTSESPPDKQPTRKNIEQALQLVREKAAYDDVVVVYLSGHGITHRAGEDDFYFLTSNARTTDYQSSEARKHQSLSGKELREFLNSLKAGKQVLIMDACASGIFANQMVAGRDLSEAVRRGIERMRNRTATYVLAGNANDKKSYESSAYGQGLLTHTLLQGMKGAALRENRYIDVSGLFQYARDQVEQISRDMNLAQVPMIVAPWGSESFDIGLLASPAEKALIPVNEARPVFRKTQLVQAGAFTDLLDLSEQIDDRFYALSYQHNAPLVFVQTDYPNAYHIAGEYTKTGNQISLKGKILRDKTAVGDLSYTGPPERLTDYLLGQIERNVR